MLGLADRGRVLDLFEAVMRGDAAGALAELGAQYADGADPMAVLRDLAEVTHWVSVVKITPDGGRRPRPSARTSAPAASTSPAGSAMRALTRIWQMLLKALEEAAAAPNADDGRRDGDHPAHPCRRPAEPRGAGAPPRASAGRRRRRARRGGRARAARRRRRAPAPAPAALPAARRPRPGAGAGAAPAAGRRGAGALRQLRGRGGAGPRAPRHEPAGRGRDRRAAGALRAPAGSSSSPPPTPRPTSPRGSASGSRPGPARAGASSVVGAGGAADDRRGPRGRARRPARPRPLAHPLVQAVLAAFPGAAIRDVRPAMARPEAETPRRRPRTMTTWDPLDPFDEE